MRTIKLITETLLKIGIISSVNDTLELYTNFLTLLTTNTKEELIAARIDIILCINKLFQLQKISVEDYNALLKSLCEIDTTELWKSPLYFTTKSRGKK